LLATDHIMEGIKLYIKESYHELVNKVTWPTWANLQSSTVVVIVASLILALIIALMDAISNSGLKMIYGL
jgi:preprotein translocase subunit SecE